MNSSLVYLYNSVYQLLETTLYTKDTITNKDILTTQTDIHFVMDYNTMTTKFKDNVNNKHYKYVTCVNITESITYKLWEIGNQGNLWKPNIINKDTDINIDLFKSHVEKCVRRMKPIEASQGLMILMLKNPYEALYKLSSICINDVVLTQGYSVIIWLMITLIIKSTVIITSTSELNVVLLVVYKWIMKFSITMNIKHSVITPIVANIITIIDVTFENQMIKIYTKTFPI